MEILAWIPGWTWVIIGLFLGWFIGGLIGRIENWWNKKHFERTNK